MAVESNVLNGANLKRVQWMDKCKILIVEDEKIVSKEIEVRLKELGYLVADRVDTGEAAIEKTEKLLPDLVLMDIRLKGDMDGIEAAEKIKERIGIPIIYLTAYADEQTLKRAKVTDPSGYLIKPFQSKELHSAIEIALYRYKTAQLLHENELRYRSLFEESNDAIFVHDLKGVILDMNQRACELMQKPKEELISSKIGSLHPKAQINVSKAAEIKLKETGHVRFESKFQRADKSLVDVEISTRIIDHDVGIAQGIVRDISKRKEAEEALLRSEEKFRSIVELSPEAIITVDVKGILTSCNQAFTKISGYSIEDVLGKHWLEIPVFRDKDKKILKSKFLRILKSQESEPFELTGKHKNGTEYISEVHVSVMRQGDQVTGIQAIVSDITDRKKYEKALIDSEKQISEQNRFNNIRAEIWKLATDESLSEIQLIQGLLDQIGPVLEVCRACYNPIVDDHVICMHEWCADGISSSIGTKLPVKLAKFFNRPGYYEYTEGESLEILPNALRAVGSSLISKIVRLLKLRTVLVVPYHHDSQWMGLMTFDVSVDNQIFTEWTAIKKKIVAETLQIIEQTISKRNIRQTLQESEEKFRTFMETASDLMFIADNQGNFSYVNNAMAKTLDHPKSDLLKMHLVDIFNKETRDLMYKPRIGELITNGEISFEPTWMTARGNEIYGEVKLVAIYDENGEFLGSRGVFRDITLRKKSEELMRIKDTAIASSINAIVMCDLDGKLTYVNNAFLKLWGFDTSEEIIGKSLIDFWQVDENAREIMETLRLEGVWTGELVAKRKDSSMFIAQIAANVVTNEGDRPITIMASFIDVSERKQAEEAMQNARDAAEAANRSKSEFLANISHEIRTPMNGIIGITELVLDSELSKQQTDYLTMVKKSSDDLLKIVNKVLDFSKIEAGKFDLEEIEFNLSDVVENTISMYRNQAELKALKLTYNIQPDVNTELKGDPVGFRQIIENVLDNAVKFTNEGRITLSIYQDRMLPKHLDKIQLNRPGHSELNSEDTVYLHMTISDTGIGIPEDKQQMIFDSFSQADGSSTRQYGGTGLGLAISKKIALMMGGDIWVESTVGKGSSFHIVVCFQSQNTAQVDAKSIADRAMAQNEREKSSGELSILLAEDDIVNQKVAVGLLEQSGHQITVVDNGKSVLSKLLTDKFDLILMDISMPQMSGIEATENIRNAETDFKDIPIIAMTAHAMKGDRERCLSCGMNDYITKPINKNDLMDILERFSNANSTDHIVHDTKASYLSVTQSSPVLDKKQAIKRLGNDEELYQRICKAFLTNTSTIVEKIKNAIESGDFVTAERHAHSLKSAAANIGAESMREFACDIEMKLRNNNRDNLSTSLHELENSYEAVVHELSQIAV